MAHTIDPKKLADGRLLLLLKQTFLQKRDQNSLMAVLNCLRDSKVVVPLHVDLSDADQERVKNAQKGEKVSISSDVTVTPDILVNSGRKFLPVFSNAAQVPKEYGVNFTMGELPFLECVKMASSFPDVAGLVLDPFTDAMLIEKQNAELISKFKSRLAPEK